MSQRWLASHAETITQNVVGQLVAVEVLWYYDIPWTTTGWKMQTTFFVLAYARGYLIRRAFNALERRRKYVQMESEPATGSTSRGQDSGALGHQERQGKPQ